MSKHTPGPWFAVNDGTDEEPMMMVKAARIAGKEPRHCVAIVATGDSPQPMENANAHIIAAAPDMYDALMSAVQFVERIGREYAEQHGVKYEDCTEGAELVKARAALAKARGE